MVGEVVSTCSVAAKVEDVVEVASLVVSTVLDPSGAVVSIEETVVCSTVEVVVDCEKVVVDKGSLVCGEVKTIGISVVAEKIVDGTKVDSGGIAEDAVSVVCISETLVVEWLVDSTFV